MTFAATAVLVLIASPGDTAEERAAIQQGLGQWNVARGEREAIVVVPWLYEQHAIPTLGSHAQGIINSQAVDRADIVVAFFDARLGTETPEAVSGTAEEIQRASAAGKAVHVYFSREPITRELADTQQLAALDEFKRKLRDEGLLGDYDSPEHLANQVMQAIDYDVSRRNWSISTSPASLAGAKLSARHEHAKEPTGTDSKGKIKYRTTSNHLIVRNDGDETAEEIRVTSKPLDGQVVFDEPEPFDLTRGSERAFPMMGLGGGNNVEVSLMWTESGVAKTFTQTIRVN